MLFSVKKILFLVFFLLALFSYSRLHQVSGAVCERNRPTLVVTADNGITGAPGQKLTYTVKVTNNDVGEACPTSRVDLSTTILNNTNNAWKAVLGKTEFTTIAPGSTKSTKLYVTSPAGATNGPKTITVNAQRPNGALISYNITYNVVAPNPTNCGGIAGLSCPAGYTCQYQNNPPNPDESGICVIPSPRVTATLTTEPTPTSTPTNGFLNVVVGIDGIGKTSRIPIGGNKNPDNIFRNLTVKFYSAETNQLSDIFDGIEFTYEPKIEKFQSDLNFGDTFTSGLYNIYIEGPRFLRAQITGSYRITKGQKNTLPAINLINGNINNIDLSENRIDLMDYNVLLSCSIYSQDLTACEENQNYEDYSDLNDDGLVDEDDFTLWLKEVVTNQQGAILPE